MRTAFCRFVPRGVVIGASLDGSCPACGKPISEHDGVTVAIDTIPDDATMREHYHPRHWPANQSDREE